MHSLALRETQLLHFGDLQVKYDTRCFPVVSEAKPTSGAQFHIKEADIRMLSHLC